MWRRPAFVLALLCGLSVALIWIRSNWRPTPAPEETLSRSLTAYRRGAFSDALTEVRRGGTDWRGRPDLHWHWEFRLLEAEILLEMGQSAQTLKLLETDAALQSSRHNIRRRILRAKVHLRRSEFSQAAALLEEALMLASGAEFPGLRTEIDLLRGQLFGRQNQIPEAEQAYGRALESALKAKDSFLQASANNGLGMLRKQRSKWDEALPWFQEALKIWKSLEARHFVAGALNNLSMCYSNLGDFDRALEYSQQAMGLAQPSARLAEVLGETGSLYVRWGQPAKAIPYYQRALAVSKEFGVPAEAARWAGNLTSTFLDIEDWARAEQINDEALRLKLEKQPGAFLLLNAAAIATGRGRSADARRIYEEVIASDSGDPSVLWASYAGLADLFLLAGDAPMANRNFEAAIRIIEQSRSDLNRNEHKITFLARLIRFYQNYVDALMKQNNPVRALEVADSCRARILGERLSLQMKAQPVGERRDFQNISLQSNTVWLSYWIAPRRSFLWIVTPREVRHFVLPPADEIARWVAQYRSFLEKSIRDPIRTENEAGRWLFHTLIGPVRSLLPPGSRVTVVPDGPLHQVNFESLPVYDAGPHYWIQDVTVSIAPSFGVYLTRSSARPASPPSALVIGNPEFADSGYPKLDHAAAEISNVANRFPHPSTKVFNGAAAQPGAYAQARPGGFSIIHIASHAEANQQSPLESAVILSPGLTGFKLYARDVMNIPLNAELVTLSACRSAGARTYAGEGLVGFAWAFLQAGAHSVIAGLWDVPDKSTALLMDRMYEQIEAGQPAADALRAAKLSLIQSNYAKPYYWAPFQIYTR